MTRWFWSILLLTTGHLATADDAPYRVYVGTYTGGDSQGIYLLEMDRQTGALTGPTLAAETPNPSFLAVHPTRPLLFAVNEIGNYGGEKSGSVTAFSIATKTGKLTKINAQPTRGDGPCHLVVDRTGKTVLVANYGGGSVASFPIADDGKLGPASSFFQHEGSSMDKSRQEAPHGHSINLDNANKFAVASDLGLDKLLVYRFDADQHTLAPNNPPFAKTPPGGGPRHFAFHPDGQHAYVILEMTSQIIPLQYDANKGTFTLGAPLSTIPEPTPGNSTAEVRVHSSGKFVYVSNRGHNSIAMFAVDSATGGLKAIGNQATGGKTPRNFGIDPSGRFLLAANQDTGNVVVFAIDPETGKLAPTGHSAQVPNPVCLRFFD